MKTTGKLTVFIFTLLALVASAYAQSPREELKQMVEQLQQKPNDNALREKIIKLATTIKPVPAIPEEAREPFVMGATVLKKASDPAGASKAVDLFTQALNIAPWFADAYYNRAIAREAAGQFELAIDDIKLYLGFKLTDAERREAQDKIYALKAEAQLGPAKKTEEAKALSAKATADAPQVILQQLQSKYGNRRVTSRIHCRIEDGRTYLLCNESEAKGTTWTPGAPKGSWSWMPIQSNTTNSIDFTSLNIRYMFRLDIGNPNRIILGQADGGGDWLCGLLKGVEVRDIEWKNCQRGSTVEVHFGVTLVGRPYIEEITHCDATRNCVREREVLE